MSSDCFHFKRFDVFHDRCAMKVGTDGVLLGAWVNLNDKNKILDAGTGSGLIALMLAQRSHADIIAIEFDKSGFEQATENVSRSPWTERIKVIHEDLRVFKSSVKFDLIVSNPPYFRNSLKAPLKVRTQARHDDSLSWDQLVEKASSMLNPLGHLAVIIPFEGFSLFESTCFQNKLYLNRKCEVSTKPDKLPKRLLLEFSRESLPPEHSFIVLGNSDNSRTTAYSDLTSDFYL